MLAEDENIPNENISLREGIENNNLKKVESSKSLISESSMCNTECTEQSTTAPSSHSNAERINDNDYDLNFQDNTVGGKKIYRDTEMTDKEIKSDCINKTGKVDTIENAVSGEVNSNKKKKKSKEVEVENWVVVNNKGAEKTKQTFQECFRNQIILLIQKLDSHMKKIQIHFKYFSGNFLYDSVTSSKSHDLINEKELCGYWTEISILNGRLDCLELHFKGKENILSSLKEISGRNDKVNYTDYNADMKNRNDDNDNRQDSNTNSNSNSSSSKQQNKVASTNENDGHSSSVKTQNSNNNTSHTDSDTADHAHRNSKQKQLNMRSSSNIRTNYSNGNGNNNGNPSSQYNYGYNYNGDNRDVFYNTQGYPFGYNNHFISGNNYYGYPPHTQTTQQNDGNNNFVPESKQFDPHCREKYQPGPGGQNPGGTNYSSSSRNLNFDSREGEEKTVPGSETTNGGGNFFHVI